MVQVILEKGWFFFVFMNGDAWHAARTNAPDIGGPCDQVKLEKLDNPKMVLDSSKKKSSFGIQDRSSFKWLMVSSFGKYNK